MVIRQLIVGLLCAKEIHDELSGDVRAKSLQIRKYKFNTK